MKVGVLSCKGGAGKTLISLNLASIIEDALYMDLDIEEPNGFLYAKPFIKEEEKIYIELPVYSLKDCNACRKCIDNCAFNALAFVNNRVKIIESSCKSCFSCQKLCKNNCFTIKSKEVGSSYFGEYSKFNHILYGKLNVGEVASTKIISSLFNNSNYAKFENVIIDFPPGSSCNVIEGLSYINHFIIVVEDSNFGFHNFKIIHELLKLYNKKIYIVLNKEDKDFTLNKDYIKQNNLDVLANIPYEEEISRINSEARLLTSVNKKYYDLFKNIYYKLKKRIENE